MPQKARLLFCFDFVADSIPEQNLALVGPWKSNQSATKSKKQQTGLLGHFPPMDFRLFSFLFLFLSLKNPLETGLRFYKLKPSLWMNRRFYKEHDRKISSSSKSEKNVTVFFRRSTFWQWPKNGVFIRNVV